MKAENGIHHTIQRDFWRMVLLTAEANNVQVFATTHSWDCVAGFAQAAAEEGVAGALVRLDSDGEGIRAVQYSERQLCESRLGTGHRGALAHGATHRPIT